MTEKEKDVRNLRDEEDSTILDKDVLKKKTVHQISEFSVVIFLALAIGFYGVIYVIDGMTPTGLLITDEVNNPDEFIAQRAQNILKELAAIGPRVVGTEEANVKSVDFLKKKIMEVKEIVSEEHEVDYDLQLASGQYILNSYVNKYMNMQNVVARLRPKLKPANYSLLLNCHYDSVPFSPGASDDGISCAVMLEVMRVMAKSTEPLRANIIFLFNGAEENPLQGAHGFITGHSWFKDVHAFLNLEAAGAGGREMVFQAGPENPWLIKYYAKFAPHPYAQCLGEELFQSGLIPSDSDFRLFRDYGKIPGMDMAFTRNGYVYHTKYDTFGRIPLGSYQHMGDNILALTRSIVASSELENPLPHAKGKVIFFDLFGLYLVNYTTSTAFNINAVVAAASLFIIFISLWTMGSNIYLRLILSVAMQIIGWVLAIGLCIAVSYVLNYFQHTMSWFYKTYLIFGLYFCPAMIGLALPLFIVYNCQSKPLSLNLEVQLHTHATTLIWTIILIVMMTMNFRSAYIPMLTVLFSTLGYATITLFGVQQSKHTWAWIYSIFAMFPALLNMYLSVLILVTAAPMFGRSGTSGTSSQEFQMAVLSVVMCIVTSSCYIPLILLVRKPANVIFGLLLFTILSLGLVLFTSLGFPYSGNATAPAPQRYMLYNTQRKFFDVHGDLVKSDSGVIVFGMDGNAQTNLLSNVPELKTAKCLGPQCTEDLYCGVPIFKSKLSTSCEQSLWIPFEKPAVQEFPSIRAVDDYRVSPQVKRFYVNVTGTSHANVLIMPKAGVKLIDWNVIDLKPVPTTTLRGRNVFFIRQSRGLGFNEWTFWIDLEHPLDWTSHLVDVSVTGHFMPTASTDNVVFKQFVSKFPDWVDVLYFKSTYMVRQY